MKGLQLAGNWKKFAVPADIQGHLEITDVHSQMRELSEGVNIGMKRSDVKSHVLDPKKRAAGLHRAAQVLGGDP
jgi:hypothetical protein